MKKASEYKEHAEECRALSRRSKSPEDREMLLNMAATWDSLAESRLKTTESGDSQSSQRPTRHLNNLPAGAWWRELREKLLASTGTGCPSADEILRACRPAING